MRVAVAIDAKHDTVGIRLRRCVPTVDLGEHGFHFRIAQFVFRIPPIERTQRFIERIGRLFCLDNQP